MEKIKQYLLLILVSVGIFSIEFFLFKVSEKLIFLSPVDIILLFSLPFIINNRLFKGAKEINISVFSIILAGSLSVIINIADFGFRLTSILGYFRWVKYFLVYFIVKEFYSDEKDIKNIFNLLGLGSIIIFIYSLSVLLFFEKITINDHLLCSKYIYGYPNHFAVFISVLLSI